MNAYLLLNTIVKWLVSQRDLENGYYNMKEKCEV